MAVWPNLTFFSLPPPSVWQRSLSLFSSLRESFFLSKHLPRTFPGWLASLLFPPAHFFPSALFSPTRWKTHLSNTGRSPRQLSSSSVAKNEAFLSKQVCQERMSAASCTFFFFLFPSFKSRWQKQQLLSACVTKPAKLIQSSDLFQKSVNQLEELPGSNNYSSLTMISPALYLRESIKKRRTVLVSVKFLVLQWGKFKDKLLILKAAQD